jgi:hypothetical protein
MGFRVLVSRHPAIQTTGLLTLAPAGLSPAEHTSLHWTHLKLNPVSFHYNDNVGIPGEQVGFIAEQVLQIDPRLVVLDASGTPFTVRYEQLTSILAKAIQQIALITGAFRDALIAWLGNAANGIQKIVADTFSGRQICLTDANGTTCYTRSELDAAVAAAGAATAVGSTAGASAALPASGDASTTSSTTSATLAVNGNNPVPWQKGQPWQDNLGALFTHEGIAETIYSTSTVEVSTAGTTTIDYWAVVPSSQQWLHATREAVVPAPANDNLPLAANDNAPLPVLVATGTEATSSAQ